MKKRSVAVNILTAIPAVLLSILLVVCLPLSAVYSVALNSITPEFISKTVQASVQEVVKSPDFEQMILENETVQAHVEELGITAEAIGELMQSEAAAEVIDLLSADFANALNGVNETNLTPEALLDIVKNHADDLADIAVNMSDEPLNKEEIKQQIVDTVERDAESLTDVLPDVETIQQTVLDDGAVQQILSLLNSTYLWIACGVCLVLALLIYALRYYRFGGFLWLGVDGVLASGVIGAIIVGAKLFAVRLLPEDMGSMGGVLTSALGQVTQALQWYAWICLGVSVLLIVGYVLLYTLVVKKKADEPAQIG